MKLFIPGRLCLFGEHSDWAGGYRRTNPILEKGYTLIVGTNQGLYADVKPHPTQFIFRSSQGASVELPADPQILLDEARRGGFFSYAAGVAYQVITRYAVAGVEIENDRTDLPIGKGLSSSAALCVLVARAFNRSYDLKLSSDEEIELAYQGERTTSSRCGRMDFGCAYGRRPILMIFDGDRVRIIPLAVPQDLFLVIVDLGASKDTREILHQLDRCYPFATDELCQNVRFYLGTINRTITQNAVEALKRGDARQIGKLMKQAQTQFDRYLKPACLSQLNAPILHALLDYPHLKPYIFGGKGVGSQGDGTAQFIAKNAKSQQQIIDIIHRDFPQMRCLKLSIETKARMES
ncbi:GHMP kinase [Oscillatoriales cyanobacterium LEGE 11467]|uniref:GHMP kinase n=1 Tax=Zarconia navalis LEGE 11467 TaxID=1828826 RepID=A0A928VVV9_9CYAN|nr:GHMP kinase [Zarconia navalis]MBE9040248.1 GHMP kinase [Zarconia navalis LEGE 11467]